MELSAFADVEPAVTELPKTRYKRQWNRSNVQNNYCGVFYDDYLRTIDVVKPDVAFILSETSLKLQIAVECAKRGVNISVEKPMAMTYKEATLIKETADKYGVDLMVNWPLTWRAYLHQMKAALDGGLIGNLVKIRFLIGNTGPVGKGAAHRGVSESAEETTDEEKASMWWYRAESGGGALLDFCSYGCMFSRWLTGKVALSVTAESGNYATHFSDVCDNAAVILKYPSALAVLEGTWTTPSAAVPTGPVIFGTNGVLFCEKAADGVVNVKAIGIYGNPLEVPPVTLPPHLKNIAEMYAYKKQTGASVHETLSGEFNLDVMKMLDAAVRSSKNGERITL